MHAGRGGPAPKIKAAGALLILAMLLASTVLLPARGAEEEHPAFMDTLVQPLDMPNYPDWEWQWSGWGRKGPDIAWTYFPLEELYELFRKAGYLIDYHHIGKWYKGYYTLKFHWPGEEEEYNITCKLRFDETTEKLAKEWEKKTGEYPLPEKAVYRVRQTGVFSLRLVYVPFTETQRIKKYVEEHWNTTKLREEGIVITDQLLDKAVRRAVSEKAGELLKELKSMIESAEERGMHSQPVVDTDSLKIYVVQGVWHCPPMSNIEEYHDVSLEVDSLNTDVCHLNTVFSGGILVWIHGKAEEGYITALLVIGVDQGFWFDLEKSEYEYGGEWASKWALSEILRSKKIPRITKNGGVAMVENNGLRLFVEPSENPLDLLVEPKETLRMLEATVYAILNRLKVSAAKPSEIKPVELPEISFAQEGEDYVKVAGIKPNTSTVLVPGKCYDLKVNADIGLYSSNEGELRVLIYSPLPGGNETLIRPGEGLAEKIKGKGEMEADIEYRVCLPKDLEERGGDSVVVDLLLIPSGKEKPAATARVTYRVHAPQARISYELSKDGVIANGRDTLEIRVRVVDEQGNPVKDRLLTLRMARPRQLSWLAMEPCLKDLYEWVYYVDRVTGEDGTATFIYRAPRIAPGSLPAVSGDKNPFPAYDKLIIEDSETGQKKMVKIKLLSPYPSIDKAVISQPVWADTWAKITLRMSDPDSKRLRIHLRSSMPGTFDYKGSFTEGTRLDVEAGPGTINMGFRSKPIGMNMREVPGISDMLWNKTRSAMWNLIPTLAAGRADVGKAYVEVEKLLKAKNIPVIRSDKLAQLLAWGDEKTVAAISKLASKAGLSQEATQQLIKYINEKAADHALTVNDWFGTEETIGGAAWSMKEKLENLGKEDVDALGLYINGFYLLVGVAGLYEDGTRMAQALKLGAWQTYLLFTTLDYLKGFKELYDEYGKMATAMEETFPAIIVVRITDPEGHAAQRVIKYYLLYHAPSGSGPQPSPGASIDKDVANAILSYYEACREEDLDKYLAVLNTQGMSREELSVLLNATMAVWNNTDTLSYKITGLETGVSKDGRRAAASYHVEGVLRIGGRTMALGYDVIAVLSKVGGEWRIDNLFLKQSFYELLAYMTLSSTVMEERAASLADSMAGAPSIEGVSIEDVRAEGGSITALVRVRGGGEHTVTGVFTAPDSTPYIAVGKTSSSSPEARLTISLNQTTDKLSGEWSLTVYVDGLYAASKTFRAEIQAGAKTTPRTSPQTTREETNPLKGTKTTEEGIDAAAIAALFLPPAIIAAAAAWIIERKTRRRYGG